MNLDPNPSDVFFLQGQKGLPAGTDLKVSATLIDGIEAQLAPDFSSLNLNEKKVALVKTSDLVIVEKFIPKAMKHCNEKSAIISFNYPEMSAKRLANSPSLISSLNLDTKDKRGELDVGRLKFYLGINSYYFTKIERPKYKDKILIHELPKEKHWGNCEEMTSYYYKYLDERLPLHINIDVVKISGGDHAFLLINRPSNLGINNYAKLDKTVVFDPWAGQWFYGHEIPQKLMDFTWDKNNMCPILSLFDITQQFLSVRFTRHYGKEEIISSQNKQLLKAIPRELKNGHLDLIFELLDSFYLSKDLNEKIHFAEKILDLLKGKDIIRTELEILRNNYNFHLASVEFNINKLRQYMDNFLSTFRDGNWITKSAKYPNRQPFIPFNHPEKYDL